MGIVILENTKTDKLETYDELEALDKLNRFDYYRVSSQDGVIEGSNVDKKKVFVDKTTKEDEKNLITFSKDSFRSPDYVERQEKKMKKKVPLLKILKWGLFRTKPLIRKI